MERLDVYLSKHSFFSSRSLAQDYIKEGLVKVNGKTVTKASFKLSLEDVVTWEEREVSFVSRGGNKLYGALKDFNIDLSQSWMIGDGENDVQAGVAAGCFTVAINTGPLPDSTLKEAGADIVFSNMNDFRLWLPNIMKRQKP